MKEFNQFLNPILYFNEYKKVTLLNDYAKNNLLREAILLDNIMGENYTVEELSDFIENQKTIQNIFVQKNEYKEDKILFNVYGDKKKKLIIVNGFILDDKISEMDKNFVLDDITEVFNKRECVNEIMKYSENDSDFYFAYFDIKNFRNFSLYYGIMISDKLLYIFANKLKKKLKELLNNKIKVYRWTNDVFSTIIDKKNITETELEVLIKELSKHFSNYFIEIDKDFSLKIDIVISVIDSSIIFKDDNFVFNIIDKSKLSLNITKQKNKKYIIFTGEEIKDIYSNLEENLMMSKHILEAVQQKTLKSYFVPYFQPLYNNKSKKIEKYESLSRLIVDGKEVLPWKFLKNIDQLKLLPDMTDIIMEKSIEKISNQPDIQICINISINDFKEGNFIERIEKLVIANKVNRENITLEILEEDGIYEFAEDITNLHKLGYLIALDDFGTGYSNFSYLSKLHVDILKIDGSLIKNILHSKKDYDILKGIIKYAKNINVKTVAEFVGDKETFEEVTKLGIDYSQGWHIGKAEPDFIH